MITPPRPRMKWYQFTIRSLLVLTVLVAIAGSWFAWKKQQLERQRAAVKWIEESGGVAIYEWETRTMSPRIPPGPAWLRKWLGDDFFAPVFCAGLVQLTDAGLEHLQGLPQLEWLKLDNTLVTDAGIERLQEFTKLRRLDLRGTKVTDAGLEHLGAMKQLGTVSLGNTQVTDAGLEQLGGLTQLKTLDLGNTQVTDAGLVHLQGLPQLEFLHLDNTQVTDEGVKKLKEALPKCKIFR